jgi:hypothetical protein
VDQLITEAFNHSKIALIDTKREAICEFVANCIERTQHTQACCGHDLAAIFGMGLQHLFGSQKAITVSREAVETLMRLAFGFEDLKQSSIFNDIRTWEASNAPRKCLRA